MPRHEFAAPVRPKTSTLKCDGLAVVNDMTDFFRPLFTALTLTCWLSWSFAAETNVDVVTELSAPLQFEENGRIVGVATEIVRELFARTDWQPEIKMMPWARAYQNALARPNVAIYSIARTPEREEHFEWIGPIVPIQFGIYRLRSRNDISVTSLADLRRYTIGVVQGDVRHLYLQKQGMQDFPEGNLNTVSSQELNYRKLFAGRIDLIVMGSMTCVTKRIDCEQLTLVHTLDELSEGLYLALRKGSDSTLVASLQSAFSTMYKDGKLLALQKPLVDLTQHANVLK